jgi:hypothetical protein
MLSKAQLVRRKISLKITSKNVNIWSSISPFKINNSVHMNFIMRKKQYELLKFSSLVSVQSFRQLVITERHISLFA